MFLGVSLWAWSKRRVSFHRNCLSDDYVVVNDAHTGKK